MVPAHRKVCVDGKRKDQVDPQEIGIERLTFALLGEAPVERLQVDYRPLMRPATDFLCLVARRYLEHNLPARGLDHFGFCTNGMTDRRCCKVPNVYFGTDRALTRIQKRLYRIERSVFHRDDHNRGRQYLRQHRVLEPIGEMLRQHAQRRMRRSFGYIRFDKIEFSLP